jgi:hypothetical protein
MRKWEWSWRRFHVVVEVRRRPRILPRLHGEVSRPGGRWKPYAALTLDGPTQPVHHDEPWASVMVEW